MQPKSLGNRAISERQKELSARIAQFPFLSLLSYPRAQLGSEVAGDQSVCLLDPSGGCSWAPSSHRGEAGRINSPWRWKRRGTSCSCRTCWRDRATTSARTAAIQLMAAMGNSAAKAKYEQKVPAFYYRPTHTDCKLLREQWIRAKYERNEFEFIEKQEPYSAGYREGFLWKRGRDNGQFLSRKFVLSEREGALKYFNKQDARDPKAIMKIETLNATFQPAKIGNPCGLQITYLKDNSTRNIFVYHSDAKEMVDWFNAIRAARFHYLQVAFPGASDEELVPKLTRSFMKEGFMEKTGPKHTEGFKKRWFTMDDRRLMYFKDPLDAYARGEVFIGSKENSYTVLAGLPPSTQGYHWNHGITIVTPDRKFLFACETEAEQQDWIAAFQRVINRPMRPQEYAVEAHFKHKP
ncbi:arf-GAP with dual PH domain-containing protein 1 isoform X2 [Simochromis diagramma]|uniref:PH domain-containing protein n=1 Tax=Astatotilapia calliptera TaxID=8154 RepID=A0A3P8QPR4_ASTCA|nr:arf-GAP with dual PH domain-containing protein 1 isoform X2 [Simochromis diagramma]